MTLLLFEIVLWTLRAYNKVRLYSDQVNLANQNVTQKRGVIMTSMRII